MVKKIRAILSRYNMPDDTALMMMIVFVLAFFMLVFVVLFNMEDKDIDMTSIKVAVALIVIGLCTFFLLNGEFAPFRIVAVFLIMCAFTGSFIVGFYTYFLAEEKNSDIAFFMNILVFTITFLLLFFIGLIKIFL